MEGQILLIDKPAGITSHDVVDRIRRIYKTRKVGHAGTLDPFATGLLILGVNGATKELGKLTGLDKSYRATAMLGTTSTTLDPEGTLTVTSETAYTRPGQKDIESAIVQLVGTFEQQAPIYSAKKVGGKKLYELARKGLGDTVERPKKQITIHTARLISFTWPELVFEVSCSSGTYIRVIAEDIGKALGCGAYLTALRRLSIGTYDLKDAKTLEQLGWKP